MKLKEIREVPTCTEDVEDGKGVKPFKDIFIHESCLRSYHILDKVVQLLNKKVPHDVIIEIIQDLREQNEL